MDSEKNWWESKTYFGVFVSFASMALNFFKIDIGGQEEWVTAIMGLLGSGFALYGRAKAVKKIK